MDSELEEISALKLYGQIFWRRRWEFIATTVVVMTSMVVHTLTQPKIYKSSLLLLVSGKEQTPQVIGDSPSPENMQSPITGELDTEVQVLHTLPLISRAVEDLHQRYFDLDAASVAGNLEIQQLGKSGIISIAYRDSDPGRLLEVLKHLGETYVDFSLTSRKSRVSSAIRFIERTLPDSRQNLAVRSKQLEIFRKRYDLIDPSLLGTSMAQALSNLDEQERDVNAKMLQNQALYQKLQQRSGFLPEQGLAATSVSQDPIYLDLLKQYQETENKYVLERLRFTDSNPQLQYLKAKRDQLNQLLQNRKQEVLGENVSLTRNQLLNPIQIAQVSQLLEAEKNIKVQQAELAAVQANRTALERNFQIVPALQRQYNNLTREVEVASKSVDHLLTKLEELRIVEAQESAPWQVIQPPYPVGKPISPNVTLNLMIGSVLALLCGSIVVYLREQLDSRLRNIRSVREMLRIPILGVVPKIDKQLLRLNYLPSDDDLAFYAVNSGSLQSQRSYFCEAFQNFLFSLRFAGADEPMKVVGFTSNTFQEGKSTIVRHLGISAVERSCQVLVVDADLRKPELHSALEVSNEQGLSNILATGVAWQNVVQNTAQQGLQILPAGPIPPNPVALLDSIRMSQLMAQLREHYDLVFVDLPPVVGLSDPLVVATHLDGLVLTIGLNQVTRDNLKASLESLSHTRSRLIGAICNMSSISEIPNPAYIRDNQVKALSDLRFQLVQPWITRWLKGNSYR